MTCFFKKSPLPRRSHASWSFVALSTALVVLSGAATAAERPYDNTNVQEEAEWKETEVPPAPAFDVSKLVTFDVAASSTLVYGVDPATIQISQKDGLIRYVMVASSPSGARNVLYEGIRCATGEFKTYARYSSEGKWIAATDPQWKSMYQNSPSKHPLRLAQAGACDNASVAQSVSSMVTKLKTPNFKTMN
jgi:hypothetical protein